MVYFELWFVLACWDCHNKIPQTIWLKQQKFVLTVLEARSPSKHWQVLVLLRPLSLACKCCRLPVPSYGLCSVNTHPWGLSSALFSSLKNTSQIGLGPPYGPHLELITFQGLISKPSHILRYWGLTLQHMNLEGQFNP